MKSKTDLVKGWLLKGKSDLSSVSMCLANEQALDIACFHAQQAAEKFLKAYLTAKEVDFPFIHHLEKFIELCAVIDPSFKTIKPLGVLLTPYALQMRYDNDFWPDTGTARRAPIHEPSIAHASDQFGQPIPGSLATILRSFKSAVTNYCHSP